MGGLQGGWAIRQIKSLVAKPAIIKSSLKEATPAVMGVGYLQYQGREIPLTPKLFKTLGFAAQYFDPRVSFFMMTTGEFKRYEGNNPGRAGGYYRPTQSTAVGRDVKFLAQERANALRPIIPEGAPLRVWAHELGHCLYDQVLGREKVNDFIMAGASAFHRLTEAAKRDPNDSLAMSFINDLMVAYHINPNPDNIVTVEKLERILKTNPKSCLAQSLDKRNETFFTELFAMSIERAGGYLNPFTSGVVPREIESYFKQTGLLL